MIKLLFTLSLLTPPAHAMSVDPFSSGSATIGATVAASISTTIAIAATVGTTYYLWTELQTRRAYHHAADEARAALSQRCQKPISNAAEDGVLRRVAEIERNMLAREGVDPDTVSEVGVARRIIAHADQFSLLQ